MPLTIRMHPGAPPAAGGLEDDTTTQRVAPVHRARRCPTCEQIFSGDARFCPFDGDPLIDAPEWDPSADPLIGKTLDARYRVMSVIGEGGMGTVYEVRHTTLDRRFALKVLRRDVAQDSELTARFIQEAKAAAAIGHPHIVAVSDFGELDAGGPGKVPYFVMEFLTGESLSMVLGREGTLSSGRAGVLMLQAASALAAAHAAGVIHRDLKPDNIFLASAGDREFVKLLDFGVAKIAGAGRLTRAGMVFGTPHYMSPEQAAGNSVDHRSDIYALGVIMYECFAGRVPFEADTYMGVLTKHMFAVPEPIQRVATDPGCLGALGPIVMRCLEKRPEDRFATMVDVGDAIALALEDPDRSSVTMLRADRRVSDGLRLREPTSGPRSSIPSRIPGTQPVVGRLLLLAVGTFAAVLLLGMVLWRVTSSAAAPGRTDESARPPEPTAAPPVVSTAPPADTEAPSAPGPSAPTAPSAPDARSAKRPETASSSARPASSGAAKRRTKSGELVDPW